MGVTETNGIDSIARSRPRLSRLAVLAFVSSLQCIVVMCIVIDVLPPGHAFIMPHVWLLDLAPNVLWGKQASHSTGLRDALALPGLTLLTVTPAMVLGFVGAIRIDRSYRRLKGVSLCMAAIGIAATCLFVASPLIPRDLGRTWEALKLIRIEGNEKQRREIILAIGAALKRHANSWGGHFPGSDNWCDLLINDDYLRDEPQILWLAGRRRWPCAINPDCGPNSPGETVLLFETLPGWNLRGGPELLKDPSRNYGRTHVLLKGYQSKTGSRDLTEELVWK